MGLPVTNDNEKTTTNVASSSLSCVSNLAKMLPTGVIFIFQILSNILSENGDCGKGHKILVGVCLGILGIICFLLSFSDSFKDSNGKVHYGIATTSGMKTLSSGKNKAKPSNQTDYKLEFKDFLGAAVAVVVFAVVSLTDKNVVQCLYPSAQSRINKWVQALPVVVSVVSSAVCVLSPSKRQGITHPVTTK